jgi:hypothetical protein
LFKIANRMVQDYQNDTRMIGMDSMLVTSAVASRSYSKFPSSLRRGGIY